MNGICIKLIILLIKRKLCLIELAKLDIIKEIIKQNILIVNGNSFRKKKDPLSLKGNKHTANIEMYVYRLSLNRVKCLKKTDVIIRRIYVFS